MDSHLVKNSKWSQSYEMKKINFTIQGFSRSAYRTGFYIKEIAVMLDAGPQNFNKPDHIFITHCHADHIAELPFTLIGDENQNHIFNIYGPLGSQKYIKNYIQSMFELNSMGMFPINTEEWYQYKELSENDNLKLSMKNNEIQVKIIECDHKIPTISYIFRMFKNKLKKEYLDLSGKEITTLKKNGIEITQKIEQHLFAYVCDCSIETIKRYEIELVKCPYVIVECTFLLDDEIENAITTKHIHWIQLEPFIAKYPNVEWLLIHFSLRHKDSEISEFFKDKKTLYPNLKIWNN